MALKRRGDDRIRAGDLNIQVQIKRDTQTTDSQGGRTGASATLGTVWARIRPTSVSRANAYGITLANKPSDVTLRYEEDAFTLDEDCYLVEVESGRTHYIQQVIDRDRNKELFDLIVTEKR